MSVEAPQLVSCSECGVRFELSARNVRACRQRGKEPVCRSCRNPPKPADEKTRARMVRWWIEESGIPLDELRDLAAAVVPLLDDLQGAQSVPKRREAWSDGQAVRAAQTA